MENLPPWAQRAIQIWLTIGTILMAFGSHIVALPAWLPAFFQQDFVDATMLVIGALITYWQHIRVKVALAPKEVNTIRLASVDQKTKTAYILNPFKLAA